MKQDASWDLPSVRACGGHRHGLAGQGLLPGPPGGGWRFRRPCSSTRRPHAGSPATGPSRRWKSWREFEAEIIPFPGSSTNPDGGSQVNFTGSGFMASNIGAHKDLALEYIDFALNNARTPPRSGLKSAKVIPPYTGKVDAEISPLLKRVQDSLADPNVKNVAGVNMWLASNAFDFFSHLRPEPGDQGAGRGQLRLRIWTRRFRPTSPTKSTKATFSFN